MKEELDALNKNNTWDLVDLRPRKSIVKCKWVYKTKTCSDGTVDRYKARIVAKVLLRSMVWIMRRPLLLLLTYLLCVLYLQL